MTPMAPEMPKWAHYWTVEEAWAQGARCRGDLPEPEPKRPKLTVIAGGKKP